MIATATGEQPLAKARGAYRAFHTRSCRRDIFGGPDDEVRGQMLEERGLAYEHFHFSFHCVSYFKRDDVTQEKYDREKRKVTAELEEKFKKEKQRIAQWFAKES